MCDGDSSSSEVDKDGNHTEQGPSIRDIGNRSGSVSVLTRILFFLFEETVPKHAQHKRLDADSNALFDETLQDRIFNMQMKVRAVYGEFIGTFCFFLLVFAAIANAYESGWDKASTSIAVGLAAGLQLVALILCFSGISGANFNPVVSLTLWATRKQSMRICIYYMIAQLLASIAAVGAMAACYTSPAGGLFDALAVTPRDDASAVNVFFSELFSTFILVYVIFTVAFEESEAPDAIARIKKDPRTMRFCDSNGLILYSSSSSSRGGFAPFAIGFAVLALAFFGGASGASMNPARMFGPAVISGKWDMFHVYLLGEITGALLAGGSVVYGQNLPLRRPQAEQRCGPDDRSCKRIDTRCCSGMGVADVDGARLPIVCNSGAGDTSMAIDDHTSL